LKKIKFEAYKKENYQKLLKVFLINYAEEFDDFCKENYLKHEKVL